jgi:hypothetical protein
LIQRRSAGDDFIPPRSLRRMLRLIADDHGCGGTARPRP